MPVTPQVSLPMAYDEHVHTVFDEYSDSGDGDGEEGDEEDEEDEEDSNDANWARKEALRQGKVWTKGALHTRDRLQLPAVVPRTQASRLTRGVEAQRHTPNAVSSSPCAESSQSHAHCKPNSC